MKLTTAFVALASSLLVEGQMETDRIEATFGVPNRPDIKPGCTMKPLDLQDLMVKVRPIHGKVASVPSGICALFMLAIL